MNIVFEVEDLGHGLVFQNLAFYGWVSHNTHTLFTNIESVISCLPRNQKTLYNAQKCYPGFLAWNKYWKECYSVDLKNKIDLDSLANVDIYYEKWVKECAESSKHSDFQKLWEVLMIRVTSEAICETAGSTEGSCLMLLLGPGKKSH